MSSRFLAPLTAAVFALALGACSGATDDPMAADAMKTEPMAADPMATDPMATDAMKADPMKPADH